MLVELSPATYIALCGLVSDALQHPSDATPLLRRAENELRNATAGNLLPSELLENPDHLNILRAAGYAQR